MQRGAFVRSAAMLAPLIATSGKRANAQADKPATIHFMAVPADDLRPILYAQSAGLFKQAGIDLDLKYSNSGATIAQAVIGGAVDIGLGSITAMIAAHTRGIPVVLVAPSMMYRKDLPTSGLIVAQSSPLHDARDLQGKIVACSALGSIAYLGIRSLVDKQGGDSSTLRFVEMPGSAVPAAVEQGRVDAGVTEEPHLSEELRTGKVRLLFDMFDGYSRPIVEAVYFAMRDYIDKNHELVSRFAKVVQDATRYADAHPAETLPLFVALSGMDPQLANRINHTYTPLTLDPAQIQPVVDLAAKYKVIPNGFDARELTK